MPVGTLGTVKGLFPDQLRAVGTQKLLANTYHLALRPGAEVVEELGGLHRFMDWDGPILTDSGGFQVFSLAGLRDIDDERVVFKSHIDGSILELTPARAIEIQQQLGADCIMCLDECPPADAPIEQIAEAVRRTTLWAQLCRDTQARDDQALFGIVQGGIDQSQREKSADKLVPLDFPGYAIGGLSVGESPTEMYRTLDHTTPHLPSEKPRYLMGVGRPEDLVESVLRGIDLFDCVMPTRNGRNATAFTSTGRVKMRNRKHMRDDAPLDPACECPACTRYCRGYLRHMFIAGEMLGPILLSLHNIAFYHRTMSDLRVAILEGRADSFRSECLAAWESE
ncbi:Queuine tRNA-ribosyltransferase [Stratiformator vulcanicus]|uniref:Queuine tRNA-ribosyltransferase n=2 Tax=Stratiformator vulcanicus TaxID=2527980 RepID=A0A517R1R2_9PLAN|nr:Queuine tRNA-ribosyltransferase [Stratiformator vulcanicus]